MSSKYIWVGGSVHLGSHGIVKHGQTLVLDDKEDNGIQGDPRFQPWKENAPKLPGSGLDLPEGYEKLSAARQAEERKIAQDKAKAAADAAKATAPGTLINLPGESGKATEQAQVGGGAPALTAEQQGEAAELRDMTIAELVAFAEDEEITVDANAKRDVILKSVMDAKGYPVEAP